MFGLYGRPPKDLFEAPAAAIQLSPMMPGSQALEAAGADAFSEVVMLAPPAAIERRREIALALKALRPGAPFTLLAPKDRGGQRLRGELEAMGCEVEEHSKRHHRICAGLRPANPLGLEAAIAEGAPRLRDDLAAWSQPGLFSWDRLDPGTSLLTEHLPALSGKGADFGCGIGLLARAALASPKIETLTLVDLDRRAVECARHNVLDPRAQFLWADVKAGLALRDLHFVIANPPFHEAGREDAGLGQIFLRRAHESLRRGGALIFVANRHLPYEAVLQPLFRRVTPRVEAGGYKVIEAMK